MKRILALVFMCGVGSSVAADAATAKHPAPLTAAQKKAHAERLAAQSFASMAPADEYFGPLKLSIIGIQNTIHDIGLRYKYNNNLAAPSFASAQLVESAVRDWAHRYAHDPQLPRNVYFLQRLYTQIAYQKSRDRAIVVAQWMAVTFPTSPQEKQLKKTLATEHLPPIPSPSPSASATASEAASAEPSPEAAPDVSPSGTFASPAPIDASAAPSPVPTAGASPSPAAGPTR